MDILLWNGEVMWNGDDIQLIDGNGAVNQQAYLRTIADKGESIFYPDYGTEIYQKLGRIDSGSNLSEIMAEIKAAFLAIDGVESVVSIDITNTIQYDKTVKLISVRYLISGNQEVQQKEFFV